MPDYRLKISYKIRKQAPQRGLKSMHTEYVLNDQQLSYWSIFERVLHILGTRPKNPDFKSGVEKTIEIITTTNTDNIFSIDIGGNYRPKLTLKKDG